MLMLRSGNGDADREKIPGTNTRAQTELEFVGLQFWKIRFMQLITCLRLRTPVKQFYPLHNYLFKMQRWFGDCIDGDGHS